MLAISKNAPKFDNPKGQRGYIRYLVVSTVGDGCLVNFSGVKPTIHSISD